MKPHELGKKYDKIAQWWRDQHKQSNYGMQALERALTYACNTGKALDVGCGAGGRMIDRLEQKGYEVIGVDVSAEMIHLAREQHPKQQFYHEDICDWQTDERFDLIIGWDSLFHLPLHQQEKVMSHLCQWLAKDGMLMYTIGDAVGEITDTWHNDTFYYSSVGIDANVRLLMRNGLSLMHLELDQYPQQHVCLMAKKCQV